MGNVCVHEASAAAVAMVSFTFCDSFAVGAQWAGVSEQIKTIISLLLVAVNEYNIWFHITLLTLLLFAVRILVPIVHPQPFHFNWKRNFFFAAVAVAFVSVSIIISQRVFFLQFSFTLLLSKHANMFVNSANYCLWSIVWLPNGWYSLFQLSLEHSLFAWFVKKKKNENRISTLNAIRETFSSVRRAHHHIVINFRSTHFFVRFVESN